MSVFEALLPGSHSRDSGRDAVQANWTWVQLEISVGTLQDWRSRNAVIVLASPTEKPHETIMEPLNLPRPRHCQRPGCFRQGADQARGGRASFRPGSWRAEHPSDFLENDFYCAARLSSLWFLHWTYGTGNNPSLPVDSPHRQKPVRLCR
jgi:hypothetical protein